MPNGVQTTEIHLNLKINYKRNCRFLTIVSLQPNRKRIIFISLGGTIEMQATATKKQLNLHEPEAFLAWIDELTAGCRVETKADLPAAGTTPGDLQVTDQFLFRCGVKCLMKVKSLVARTKVEIMALNEAGTVQGKLPVAAKKACNNCKKTNHFVTVCQLEKINEPFCWKRSQYETEQWQYHRPEKSFYWVYRLYQEW